MANATYTFTFPTQLKNLVDPSSAKDAATKAYVDAQFGSSNFTAGTNININRTNPNAPVISSFQTWLTFAPSNFTVQSTQPLGFDLAIYIAGDARSLFPNATNYFTLGNDPTIRTCGTPGYNPTLSVTSILTLTFSPAPAPGTSINILTAEQYDGATPGSGITFSDNNRVLSIGTNVDGQTVQVNSSNQLRVPLSSTGGLASDSNGLRVNLNSTDPVLRINANNQLYSTAFSQINGVTGALGQNSMSFASPRGTITFTSDNVNKVVNIEAIGSPSSSGTATARNTGTVNQRYISSRLNGTNSNVGMVQIGTATAYSDNTDVIGVDTGTSASSGNAGYEFKASATVGTNLVTASYTAPGNTVISSGVSGSVSWQGQTLANLLGGMVAPRLSKYNSDPTVFANQFPGFVQSGVANTAFLPELGITPTPGVGYDVLVGVDTLTGDNVFNAVFPNGLPYIIDNAQQSIGFMQWTGTNPATAVPRVSGQCEIPPPPNPGYWATGPATVEQFRLFYAQAIVALGAATVPANQRALQFASITTVSSFYFRFITNIPSAAPAATPNQYASLFSSDASSGLLGMAVPDGSYWTNGRQTVTPSQGTVYVSTRQGQVNTTDALLQAIDSGTGTGVSITGFTYVPSLVSGRDGATFTLSIPTNNTIQWSGSFSELLFAPDINIAGVVPNGGYWTIVNSTTSTAPGIYTVNCLWPAGFDGTGLASFVANPVGRIMRPLPANISSTTPIPFNTASTSASGVVDIFLNAGVWQQTTTTYYPNGGTYTNPTGTYNMSWVVNTPTGCNINSIGLNPTYSNWNNHVISQFRSSSAVPTWAQVLAQGNTTSGQNPTIGVGDTLTVPNINQFRFTGSDAFGTFIAKGNNSTTGAAIGVRTDSTMAISLNDQTTNIPTFGLAQQGATDGQVLSWSNSRGSWFPATIASSSLSWQQGGTAQTGNVTTLNLGTNLTGAFNNGVLTVNASGGSATLTWTILTYQWSQTPTSLVTDNTGSAVFGTTTVMGNVTQYVLGGVTRYRFIPQTYDPQYDAYFPTYTPATKTVSGTVIAVRSSL